MRRRGALLLATPGAGRQTAPLQRVEDEDEFEDDYREENESAQIQAGSLCYTIP